MTLHKVKGCVASKWQNSKRVKHLVIQRQQFTGKLLNAARQGKSSRLYFELQKRKKKKERKKNHFTSLLFSLNGLPLHLPPPGHSCREIKRTFSHLKSDPHNSIQHDTGKMHTLGGFIQLPVQQECFEKLL